MELGEKTEIHIPSILGSEIVARDFAASAARMMGFTEQPLLVSYVVSEYTHLTPPPRLCYVWP